MDDDHDPEESQFWRLVRTGSAYQNLERAYDNQNPVEKPVLHALCERESAVKRLTVKAIFMTTFIAVTFTIWLRSLESAADVTMIGMSIAIPVALLISYIFVEYCHLPKLPTDFRKSALVFCELFLDGKPETCPSRETLSGIVLRKIQDNALSREQLDKDQPSPEEIARNPIVGSLYKETVASLIVEKKEALRKMTDAAAKFGFIRNAELKNGSFYKKLFAGSREPASADLVTA